MKSLMAKMAGGDGPSKPMPSEQAMGKAVEGMHKWLKAPTSPLRSVLSILSGHGLFFAAYTAEKTTRTVECKPASASDATTAMLARIRDKGSGDAPD